MYVCMFLESDYPVDVEDLDDETVPKYFVKLANEDPRYQYKLIKKKNSGNSVTKKESAFRERSHHSDNERLRDLFMDKSESEEDNMLDENVDNDAEYALLLGQLWSKYKYNKEHGNNVEVAPQGVVKLSKEKVVKKRYPDNWGPIAFKRKRSSELETDRPILYDYDSQKNELGSAEPNYNSYTLSDEDKDDLREEYAIAFQPLDDDSTSDDEDQYTYDTVEKRFPVTKRSSSPYNLNTQKKRFAQSQNKRETSKTFRSSAGTDPKIMKDLSKIFGDSDIDIIKSPVKRSSDNVEHEHDSEHEAKVPIITGAHNKTHEHNITVVIDEDSHEHHGHNIHHPGVSGKEVEHENMHNHDHGHDHTHSGKEKPIHIKKKSIDWSDYFGVDKRSNKPVTFVNDLTQDRLRKQYFDTFNKEVIYPLNTFRRHTNAKRNYMEPKPNGESEIQIDRAHLSSQKDEKRSSTTDNDSKLDNIDKKLRNMEGLIVDEALHYSNVGTELDSKEEQEMKEKLLSRLAAAYSLEKMRKALKEFKQSLQIQKPKFNAPAPIPTDETKAKRVAVKKEKVELINNEVPGFEKGEDRSSDFEDEQGAGHYINGKMEDQFSEGYMGGSGRHRIPVMATGNFSDNELVNKIKENL